MIDFPLFSFSSPLESTLCSAVHQGGFYGADGARLPPKLHDEQ